MGLHLIGFSLLNPADLLIVLEAAFGLGAVIFVHELGHFAVAKWCGVKCEKFYLGFDIGGLKLARFRWGETEYGIGILPLGGYVKMLGQDDNPGRQAAEIERSRQSGAAATSDAASSPAAAFDPRSYLAKSVPQRMAIISAGVIMNVIFAFVVSVIAYSMGVKYHPCVISEIVPGDVAWEAGLRPGDEVVRLDDIQQPRLDMDLVTRVAVANLQKGIDLEVARPGVKEHLTINVKPRKGAVKERPTIGVGVIPMGLQLYSEKPLAANSPANTKRRNLLGKDVIVAVNDEPVSTYAEFKAAMARHASESVTLTVQRPLDASEELARSPGDPLAPEAERTYREFTTVKVAVPPRPMLHVGISMALGRILAVQADSPAARAGVKKFDRLLTIDGENPGDPMTLSDRLRARQGETVRLELAREGEKEPVVIKIKVPPVPTYEHFIRDESPASVPALGIAIEVENKIASVDPSGPARAAGIRAGQKIVRVSFLLPAAKQGEAKEQDAPKPIEFQEDGRELLNWASCMIALQDLPRGTRLELEVEGGTKATLSPVKSATWFNPDRGLIFDMIRRTRKSTSFSDSLTLGARQTKESVLQVYWFIQKLTTGQISVKTLRGPFTIARAAGESASSGESHLLLFLALLSANLAVVNFLPIPLLDGGHMVFLALEWIRGKPVSEKVVLAFHYLGFCFIIGLMIFVLTMDFTHSL